ncbi:hypothetical protein DENSPDRAFT_399038 [Dentipellis sp. KUC8613]|nr:hypothetical protein DENSPDRAFT_399038 [Dentipellis sp. KUC8613]
MQHCWVGPWTSRLLARATLLEHARISEDRRKTIKIADGRLEELQLVTFAFKACRNHLAPISRLLPEIMHLLFPCLQYSVDATREDALGADLEVGLADDVVRLQEEWYESTREADIDGKTVRLEARTTYCLHCSRRLFTYVCDIVSCIDGLRLYYSIFVSSLNSVQFAGSVPSDLWARGVRWAECVDGLEVRSMLRLRGSST